MKKTLIALATLAAVSGTAFAQSTATIYGIVDLGYQSTKNTVNGASTKQTAMANGTQSGSRIGFKGTEDLGGGLKANFVVEAGIKPDEGDMEFGKSNRQSFVGLEGGFGSLNLGRQYTLHHVNQGAADMLGNIGNAGYIGGLDSLVRVSNAFTYTSPSFSGFTAAAQIGLGETTTSSTVTEKANELSAIRLAYANGPLAVSFANETVKNPTAAFGAITWLGMTAADVAGYNKRKVNSLAASYDFGIAKVGFVNNNSKFAETGANDLKWKGNTISASMPMGALTLLASTGSGKFSMDGSANSTKASAYQLGASYALSKRTNAFAFTGQTKFTDTGAAADKQTQTTVGVRHSF